ncbi:peptidase dimerization domain-containing protein [Sphingobium sp. AS12]|uniref:M20 family metallopeptidase n=1 Tax=Sphingobium sp. AS12 TaxID=2849495 RepID=UPI001C31B48A|nr:peptidase dimerization domain-containing protein [Sphingobium sp. AS12]MBV2149825.1 peptidase dimerization domain-containing protein [Sphingobium sp. AS12]
MSLPPALRRSFEQACSHISRDRLAETLTMLVDTPSPTGGEAPLARRIAAHLADLGIEAHEQRIQVDQSNAVGWLGESGGGASLLLYSPIDTVTSNDAAEDLPWAGETLRTDMRAKAWREGDTLFGLGAQNPKGHAACILMAAEALARAKAPLAGQLRLGFGAGGMPTDSRQGKVPDTGHGVGCAHMLAASPLPDFAIIAKTGWAVSWEEVGLAWYEVRVRGTHSYVGSRHLLPYANAIEHMGRVVRSLEQWFPIWAEQNRSGLVAPQGVVSFIEGGTARTAAFTPAECRIRLDLRLSPRTTPDEADEAIGQILEELAASEGIDLCWRRLLAIPGTSTREGDWIIRSTIAGWEEIEGRAHTATPGLSGATDANILRAHGVPTARIGLPKAPLDDPDFQLGMNAAYLPHMERLTRLLVHSALVTCNRPPDGEKGG